MKPQKHGRDHAPGGEDPIAISYPWAWIRFFTTPQAIPAGGSAFLTFEHFETNAPDVWSTDEAFGFGNNTAGDMSLSCRVNGLVVVHWQATWADDATGPYEHEVDVSFNQRRAGGSSGGATSMGWENRDTFEDHILRTTNMDLGVWENLSDSTIGSIKFLAVNGVFASGASAIHNVKTFNAFAILFPTPSTTTTFVY